MYGIAHTKEPVPPLEKVCPKCNGRRCLARPARWLLIVMISGDTGAAVACFSYGRFQFPPHLSCFRSLHFLGSKTQNVLVWYKYSPKIFVVVSHKVRACFLMFAVLICCTDCSIYVSNRRLSPFYRMIVWALARKPSISVHRFGFSQYIG